MDNLPFRPLAVNAHYVGIERGLVADALAARALGGEALTVCTAHVSASHGVVTDVLDVPSDAVEAQLEHVFKTASPSAVRLGIMPGPKTVEGVFRLLGQQAARPTLLDLTLSGPSGEDIAGGPTVDALVAHLSVPDLVAIRRRDAELVCAMEITSLDDAQVAVQRLTQRGARHVLLRCGALPARFYEGDGDAPPFVADLYFDGSEFALFEAPLVDRPADLHGASSLLAMTILRGLSDEDKLLEAVQQAKRSVAEALRFGASPDAARDRAFYFWDWAD